MSRARPMGEYWLQGDQAVFADGDVGDRNHEGVAWDRLFSEFVDACDACDNAAVRGLAGLLGQGGDPAALRCAINDHFDAEFCAGQCDEAARDDPGSLIRTAIGWQTDAWRHLVDDTSEDLRLWAGKRWGWVRVVAENVQLYATRLSADIRRQLVRGLEDAYYEQLGEALEQVEFTVELLTETASRSYHDVTLEQLREGRLPQPIVAYRDVRKPSTN